jgi:hypothetical protein
VRGPRSTARGSSADELRRLVDFECHGPHCPDATIAFVEAVKDLEGVNKRFREFYDISLVPMMNDPDRIILYDDAAPLRQVDLIILQDVSNVVRFSDAESRLRLLAEGRVEHVQKILR